MGRRRKPLSERYERAFDDFPERRVFPNSVSNLESSSVERFKRPQLVRRRALTVSGDSRRDAEVSLMQSRMGRGVRSSATGSQFCPDIPCKPSQKSPAECHSSSLAIFGFDHHHPVGHVAALAAMAIRPYAHLEFACPRVGASPHAFAGAWRPIAPVFSYCFHEIMLTSRQKAKNDRHHTGVLDGTGSDVETPLCGQK